jgi:hypothetical protein
MFITCSVSPYLCRSRQGRTLIHYSTGSFGSLVSYSLAVDSRYIFLLSEEVVALYNGVIDYLSSYPLYITTLSNCLVQVLIRLSLRRINGDYKPIDHSFYSFIEILTESTIGTRTFNRELLFRISGILKLNLSWARVEINKMFAQGVITVQSYGTK